MEIPARPHASKAQRDQGGTTAANAPADSRPGALAGAGYSRLPCLSCRADQLPGTQRFPLPHSVPLAAHAAATQSEGQLLMPALDLNETLSADRSGPDALPTVLTHAYSG